MNTLTPDEQARLDAANAAYFASPAGVAHNLAATCEMHVKRLREICSLLHALWLVIQDDPDSARDLISLGWAQVEHLLAEAQKDHAEALARLEALWATRGV